MQILHKRFEWLSIPIDIQGERVFQNQLSKDTTGQLHSLLSPVPTSAGTSQCWPSAAMNANFCHGASMSNPSVMELSDCSAVEHEPCMFEAQSSTPSIIKMKIVVSALTCGYPPHILLCLCWVSHSGPDWPLLSGPDVPLSLSECFSSL